MNYQSSLNEVDFFLGSNVYDDQISDFEDWLEGALGKLEHAETIVEIHRAQGRVEVMRDVLNWAKNFRDILEEELENVD